MLIISKFKIIKRFFKFVIRIIRVKIFSPREEILISITLLDTITSNEIEETSSLFNRVNLDKLIA